MEYEILGVRWIGSSRGQLGVVAFKVENDACLATIGVIDASYGEEYAMQDIAGWGAKLSPQEAHGFFPHLDIKTYNDYRL